MTGHDNILWQSARNLLDAQDNLNKLYHSFWQIECDDTSLKIEEIGEDESGGDFIQPVWNSYFVHRRTVRANAKAIGFVTIGIQLTADEGTEADWADGKRSKVIIGYSIGTNADDAWEFTTDGPNEAGYLEECTTERLFWRVADNADRSWFYAVPLDQLTNTKRVRELIVSPVHEILRGGNVEDVYGSVYASLAKIEASLCLPPQASAVA